MNKDEWDYVNWMNSLLNDNPKRRFLAEFLHWLDEKHVTLCVTANPGTFGEHPYIPDDRTPEQLIATFLATR